MDRFIRENWRGGRGLVLRRKKTKKKKMMIMKRAKVSFPDSLKQNEKENCSSFSIFVLLLLPKIFQLMIFFPFTR